MSKRSSATRQCVLRLALVVAALWPGLVFAQAQSEEAQFNVVVSLYNAGQWQAAISKIEEREKLDLPEAMRAKYLFAKGLAYEKGNKAGDARAAFEQLLTKFPKSPEADTARVSVLYADYAKGDYDAVIAGHAKIDQGRLSAANKKNVSLMVAEAMYAKKADAAATLAAYRAAVAAGADASQLTAKLFDLNLRLSAHADLLAVSEKGVPGFAPEVVAVARAEAMLALNRPADADAEAQKVPANASIAPRAAFVRAQALLKQNKLKDAVAPLKAAIAGLKDPPAPPAAHVALVECLLESGATDEAGKAIDQAEKSFRSLPEADRTKFGGQLSMLRIRAAMGVPGQGGAGSPGTPADRKKFIAAINDARATAPKEQLPKLLYARLYALSEDGAPGPILDTMKDDFPIFQAGAEDGPASLIYAKALRDAKKPDDALKLLDEFIKRKPAAPEASRARLMLASTALEKNDLAQAKSYYDALAADGAAPNSLGKPAFDEAMFNRAIVSQRQGDHAAAAKALAALVASKPDAELLRKALPLLGQSYAAQKDYANAAAAWKQALAAGKPDDEADLRDRLARVLLAANDHAGAAEQCDAAAKLAGGEAKLSRELREVWARAAFAGGKFPDAAARYQALAQAFSDNPGYAYEAAVAYDRAGQRADAAKWYALAQQNKAKLPANYAASVDAALAASRLDSGDGDMGLNHWLDTALAPPDDKAFEAAISAVRKVAAKKELDGKARERLAAALPALGVDQPRRYALGAVLVQAQFAAKQTKDAGTLAEKLIAEFTENEKKLDPKSSGATIAPAMLHYHRGETQRLSSRFADALVSFETVLSAYPYNEWPDAAACGAAECLVALGEKDAAIARFKEVVAAPATPANARWRELAANRAAELEKK